MAARRSSRTPCLACHAPLVDPPPARCPRCGADNRAAFAWRRAGWRRRLPRFLLRSPWGWLALLSLLAPPVSWGALDFKLKSPETALLLGFTLAGLAGLGFIYARRDALWLAELARRAASGGRGALLPLAGAGLALFILVGGYLLLGWGRSSIQGGAPGAPPGWPLATALGAAFAGQTLAAGLFSLLDYGRWLSRTFPGPVFLKEGRLLRLVAQAAEPRLRLGGGGASPAAIRCVACRRTAQAGLRLTVRAESETDQALEGHYLRAVQHWQVVADRWGRIERLARLGPLEYRLDPGRPYHPPAPESLPEALQGELIFPRRRPSAEEAIITALTT